MTTQDAFTIILDIVDTILSKMHNIGEWMRRFISEVSVLFIGIKGRKNFLQMERIGQYSEKTYRNNFNERFDFLKMNSTLIDDVCSDQKIIAFDPAYLSKSGKHTPEVGMFYSGSSGMSMRGIEIGVLCVVNIKQNTAYSLESKAQDIVTNYRSRFQIEFLIRDSKQYTGLQTCEARSINKLNLHHNMYLFATSLAKAIIRKQHGKHEEIILSVGDIQTEINNELLVNLFTSMSEIDKELIKNKLDYQKIRDFGKVAA